MMFNRGKKINSETKLMMSAILGEKMKTEVCRDVSNVVCSESQTIRLGGKLWQNFGGGFKYNASFFGTQPNLKFEHFVGSWEGSLRLTLQLAPAESSSQSW